MTPPPTATTDSVPSRGSVAPSDYSPDLPSRENMPVIQGAQADKKQGCHRPEAVSSSKENQTKNKPQTMEKQGSQSASEQTKEQSVKPKRTLKSLKNFPHEAIYRSWYANKREGVDIFTETIVDLAGREMELTLNNW